MEDEDVIEYHVKHAHHSIEHAWHFHIAAASQTRCCQTIELQHRQCQCHDGEVFRSPFANFFISTKPYRQKRGNGSTYDGKQAAECHSSHDALADDVASSPEVVGADMMRHLHSKTSREG